MTVKADIQSFTPGAIVELYELDTTVIGGTDVLRFTPHGPNEMGNDCACATGLRHREEAGTTGKNRNAART